MIHKKLVKLKAAFLFFLFIAAYWIPLSTTVKIWNEDPDYSYGFLIPICSLYFLWENRQSLSDVFDRRKTFWPALPLLLFSVLLSVYGILGSSGSIAKPITPIVLMMLALYFFGVYSFKKLFMPLAFLMFMIPLPYVVQNNLAMSLKKISSLIGGELIRLFNIPVFISGNIIDIGGQQLHVVDACNGIRYLIPLLALSVAYGYLFEKSWKRILACAFISIPFSVFANGIRIGITGILVNFFGPSMAEGTLHDAIGWGIFVLILPLVYYSSFLIFKFIPFFRIKPQNEKIESIVSPEDTKGVFDAGFIVSAILLIAVLIFSLNAKSIPHYKLNKSFNEFSLQSYGWHSSFDPVEDDIVTKSASQDYYNGKFFKDGSSKTISLFLGYMFNPFLDNANFFHSPSVCMPGSGWKIVQNEKRIVSGVPVFNEVPVSEMIVENMGDKLLVYYWFQTIDKVTHDKQLNRMHLSMHAIKGESTYDLFLRPITEIGKDESIEEARKRLDAYVIDLIGGVNDFIKINKMH